MSGVAGFVAEGLPHHVTERGEGREKVFRCPEDRALYKDLLHHYAERSGLALWAYWLMPNRIHLICVPPTREGAGLPAEAARISGTHAGLAKHFDIVGRSRSHVWQEHYFSCALDRGHYWQAMAYTVRNPVRAGLIGDAADYPYSSSAGHTQLVGCSIRGRSAHLPRRLASRGRCPSLDRGLGNFD
jgi:putative transposase